MYNNSEGNTVGLKTADDFITASGHKMGGAIWCTTLRCSAEEALAFLLDVTSRSLMSERDVELIGKEGKTILEDNGYKRSFKVVEEMSLFSGTKFYNKIVRKMVYNIQNGDHISNRQSVAERKAKIFEHKVYLFGSPTVEEEDGYGDGGGGRSNAVPVGSQRSATSRTVNFLHRRSSAALAMRIDNSMQASERSEASRSNTRRGNH